MMQVQLMIFCPGDFPGGNDWRGGFGEQVERDDFYPDRVSTHILNSSERYQKDWSVMGPRDPAMEKLVNYELIFTLPWRS